MKIVKTISVVIVTFVAVFGFQHYRANNRVLINLSSSDISNVVLDGKSLTKWLHIPSNTSVDVRFSDVGELPMSFDTPKGKINTRVFFRTDAKEDKAVAALVINPDYSVGVILEYPGP